MLSGSQEACERVVKENNDAYQTDTYWAEPWEEEKLNWPNLTDAKFLDIVEEIKRRREDTHGD